MCGGGFHCGVQRLASAVVALREFVARRKNGTFRRAMAEMAADPAIQAENAAIAREFAAADGDGLSHEYAR